MTDERRWTILVCPECGRDDRHTPIGRTKHWRGGVRCDGVPVAVVVGPVSPGIPVTVLRTIVDAAYEDEDDVAMEYIHAIRALLDEYEVATE